MMIKSPKKFCLEDCFRASAPPLGLPSGNLELGRSRRTGTNIDIRSKSFREGIKKRFFWDIFPKSHKNPGVGGWVNVFFYAFP